MVASECFPLVKTGGLADVVGALPGALAMSGCEARVMLPAYPAVTERAREKRVIATYDDLIGGQARLVAAEAQNGVRAILVDAPHLYDRPGNPYLGPDGRDWPDNHRRFAALAQAAARFAAEKPDGWSVDVLHCHDWQAGLTPIYLDRLMPDAPPSVFTIHNIAFPGVFAAANAPALGLTAAGFTPDGYEYYSQISFLKAGLAFSDYLTTVSPTYAHELQTPQFGMGFDGLLRARREDLVGILNGIDDEVWNPETDSMIAATYGLRTLGRKKANREAVQNELELDLDPTALLACVVSRLTDQKGLDLLAAALPQFVASGGQLALLGSGTPELEAMFATAATQYPGRIGVRIAYDEPLSHLLIAGADAILVPSRFEPCGLTQLYGLRYGTVPVVARTGGLVDSIIDANTAAVEAGSATGIVFDPIDVAGLSRGLARAFDLFKEPGVWKQLVRTAMRQPVGWSRSAARYDALYRSAITKGRTRRLGMRAQ